MNKKGQNDKGRAFEKYCERSGMRYSQIAKELGLDHPQNLTHWRNRGVPAKRAVQVATLLGCRPDEISDTIIDPSKADEYTGHAARRREVRELLNSIVDDLDDPKALELLAESGRSIHKSFSK